MCEADVAAGYDGAVLTVYESVDGGPAVVLGMISSKPKR
jgi:hypothetical protein